MDAKVEVRQDLRALNAVFDELTETVPASELPVFRQFVSDVTATMAAIQIRWAKSSNAGKQIFEVSEHGAVTPLATDLSAVKQQMAQIDRAVEQLWLDAATRKNNEVSSEEETARYFPMRGSPRRQVSADELREATAQWEMALERGRSHRDQAIAQVGPILTPNEVVQRLGVSSVTVKNWRQQGKLLGFKFDDHQFLYPVFQFADTPSEGEDGILRHFPAILQALPFESAWAKAQFFLAPSPALNGRTPIQVVRDVSRDDARRLGPEDRKSLLQRLLAVAAHAGEMGA